MYHEYRPASRRINEILVVIVCSANTAGSPAAKREHEFKRARLRNLVRMDGRSRMKFNRNQLLNQKGVS